MSTVTLVLPVLNEEVGLRAFLPYLMRVPRVTQVLVVDGGSTDASVAVAKAAGCDVVVQERPGMREAHLAAHPRIRGELTVLFSPDGNSKVEDVPAVIDKLLEGHDLVIASRYKDGAVSEDDTLLTRLGNWSFTKLISLFGYPFTDALVIFRGYPSDLPKRLGLLSRRSTAWERWLGRYSSFEPQLSIRAAKRGFSICEVPSDELRRLDETGAGAFLPASRISHLRVGLVFLALLVDEALQ